MPVSAIPDGYHSIQPYLHVHSSAEAIEFYKRAFGATEVLRMEQQDGRIGHAELRFGNSIIMLADEFPERGFFSPRHFGGAPFSLQFYVEDCDAVYRQAIAAGAESLRESADQFYGDRSAGVKDPFGFQWRLATHIRDISLEQLQKTAAEQSSS